MKICKVYKTSKGYFWVKDEAEKRNNRVKTHGSRPGDPVEYEPVLESYVLIADIETDQGVRGMGVSTCVFELKECKVQ